MPPTPDPNVAPQNVVIIGDELRDFVPPAPFASACEWARDGFQRAMQGMGRASTGVSEYHIGSRGLHYIAPDKQIGSVGWWAKLVEYFCGTAALPSSITGADTAFRVIPRDV